MFDDDDDDDEEEDGVQVCIASRPINIAGCKKKKKHKKTGGKQN